MPTHTNSLVISKKGKYTNRKKTWTVRFKEITSKVISFRNKTMEYVIQALETLRHRYKKVRLLRQVPIGAGLYMGKIELIG